MTTAVVTVDVDEEGRAYPIGSDTPLSVGSIRSIEYSRRHLKESDIVVDTYGRAWLIASHIEDAFTFPILMASAVDKPELSTHISDLQAPMIRIYHNGEPRHDLFR